MRVERDGQVSLPAMLLLATLLFACDAVQERLDALEGTADACETRAVVHPDADGDGRGDADTVYVGCTPPEGWIADGTDCDDADAAIGACDTGSE